MFNLEKLVTDVFLPQKGERMLIVCDIPHDNIAINNEWSERIEMAKEWKEKLCSFSKKYGFAVVDDILFYNATGSNNGPLPKFGRIGDNEVVITDALSDIDVCIAMTEYSATAPLTDIAKSGNRLRVASMPRVKKSMEETALAADYNLVAKKCSVLTPKLTKAVGALILFSTGHILYVDLRNRVAESDDGMCRKDKSRGFPTINLPSGESFIAPYEGEDKKLGESLTSGRIPLKINDEMVVCVVRENKIIEVEGLGIEAEKKRKFLSKDAGRRNIAELGLGVNEKAIISGNVLEDEKVGLHIGTGRSSHLGGTFGVDNFEKPENVAHYDDVFAKGCPVEITFLMLHYSDEESEIIIENGDYVKSLFSGLM